MCFCQVVDQADFRADCNFRDAVNCRELLDSDDSGCMNRWKEPVDEGIRIPNSIHCLPNGSGGCRRGNPFQPGNLDEELIVVWNDVESLRSHSWQVFLLEITTLSITMGGLLAFNIVNDLAWIKYN